MQERIICCWQARTFVTLIKVMHFLLNALAFWKKRLTSFKERSSRKKEAFDAAFLNYDYFVTCWFKNIILKEPSST